MGKKKDILIKPYGESLVDLSTNDSKLLEHAYTLSSIQLDPLLEYDLEMLSVGAFSPLDRFLGKRDFETVSENMRLHDGTIFPMPIILPIDDNIDIKIDQEITLRNKNNMILGIIQVEEIYKLDKDLIADHVIGSTDTRHPFLSEISSWGKRAISGKIITFDQKKSRDFLHLRKTPKEVRKLLNEKGNPNVVAFQTRNPMHRVHEAITKMAADRANATLLLHPVVGKTKPGDVDHFTRVRVYETMIKNYYDDDKVVLSLLPLAMRMAGPREALWHMIIRRNYGANHMIIGRDHAGPGKNSKNEPFYDPYDAHRLAEKHSKDIGVKVVSFKELHYLVDEDRYEESDKIEKNQKTKKISGTKVREKYLKKGKKLPKWFTRPEVAKLLAEVYKPTKDRGFCIWLTGLSGSGKTTIATALHDKLREAGKQVTLLDGDVVRTNLSKGLGFSKEDRDINIRRIGFVASEIVRHGGIVIASAISPYEVTRNEVRNMIGEDYIEVFVDTPMELCEKRDIKGLYKQAREGKIKNFTGVDDPYQKPKNPEVHIKTTKEDIDQSVNKIYKFLKSKGYIN